MKICVNGLSVVTGGGLINLSGLLRALAAEDRTNQYLVLAPERRVEHFITDAPNFRIRPMHAGVAGVAGRLLWEQMRLPKLLARERIDLLFSPANFAPLRLPPGIRSVIKVQNIAPFSNVALHLERGAKRKARLRLLRHLTVASLKHADAAIFISEASRALAGRHTRHPVVIYDGLTAAGPAAARDGSEVASRYGIKSPFVLCVADWYPHKNLETLVRGFALIPAARRQELTLVLVGRPIVTSYAEDLRREIEALGPSVGVLTVAGMPHADLEALYERAAVYAFPSLVEAGGTTLVEAMAAGRPIVTSSVEPMPEFCGEAALYCDPHRPGEWASTMARALTDERAARTLGDTGRTRAASFRWREAARRTIELFEAVAPR